MEQQLPIWQQILVLILAAITLASPFVVVLYTRLNKVIPQVVTAFQSISQNQSQIAPKLDENSDLLKKLVEDRASQDQFTQALVKRLWDTIDGYKVDVNTMRESIASLQLQVNDRERKSLVNTKLIEDLTTDVERLQKDSSSMQQDLNAEKLKVKETEDKLAKAQADLDQARKEVAELRDRLTILETQHTVDVAEKERLTVELKAKDDRIKELETRVKELETELAELRTKFNTPPEPPKDATP